MNGQDSLVLDGGFLACLTGRLGASSVRPSPLRSGIYEWGHQAPGKERERAALPTQSYRERENKTGVMRDSLFLGGGRRGACWGLAFLVHTEYMRNTQQ
jgi:hypothetical protein